MNSVLKDEWSQNTKPELWYAVQRSTSRPSASRIGDSMRTQRTSDTEIRALARLPIKGSNFHHWNCILLLQVRKFVPYGESFLTRYQVKIMSPYFETTKNKLELLRCLLVIPKCSRIFANDYDGASFWWRLACAHSST